MGTGAEISILLPAVVTRFLDSRFVSDPQIMLKGY
ncbi:MAG: hypothetical protein RL254_1983 [Planctomycetota bacterium]